MRRQRHLRIERQKRRRVIISIRLINQTREHEAMVQMTEGTNDLLEPVLNLHALKPVISRLAMKSCSEH